VIRVMKAELFKMRTTPGLWILVGVTLLLTGLLGILPDFFVTVGPHHTIFTAPHTVPQLRLLVGAGYEPGALLAPVLGVLCITTEYRQKVLTVTLLVTPRRSVVLVAKVVASAIWGVVLGVASLVMVAALGVPLFESQGGRFSTLVHQIGPVVPGLLGAYALLAVFGMGIGTLLRNQVGAVIFALALSLVLEPVIVLLVHHILHDDLNWFPSRSTAALAGGLTRQTQGNAGEGPLLSWWLGGLALLGWGAGSAAVGYFTTFRRDVT
jgi:ABC-type transport system involved in multi-copper enzyme maturation permease subunit